MTRPRAILPSLLMFACEPDDLVDAPTLVFAVERVQLAPACGATLVTSRCWLVLEGDKAAFEKEEPGRKLCDDDMALPPTQRHADQPGQTRYFVSATFDEVDFDTAPSLQVSTLVDGNAVGTARALEMLDDGRLVATGVLPAVVEGSVRLRVDGDRAPFPRSAAVVLDPPTLLVSLRESTDPLPAGLGNATVCIEAPAGFPESIGFESQSEGGAVVSDMLTMTNTGNARRWGFKTITVPTIPATWTLTAILQSIRAEFTREVVDASPLALTLTRADGSDVAVVTSGDPRSACRTFTVEVAAGDLPIGTEVSLEASAGRFIGGAATLGVDVTSSHNATATLVLPTTIEGDVVTVSASAEQVERALLEIEVSRFAAAGGGSLSGPLGGTIPVDEDGSAGRTLNGRLTPPHGGVFPADTTARVQLGDATDIDAALQCDDQVVAGDLSCSEGIGASCGLFPTAVEVSADGTFTIPITSGLCFSGTATVEVLADAYAGYDAGKCLADLQVDVASVLVSTTVTFVALPPEPEPPP